MNKHRESGLEDGWVKRFRTALLGGAFMPTGIRAYGSLRPLEAAVPSDGRDASFHEAATGLEMCAPVWKRVLDLTLVFLTVPVWLPVMALIAAVIKTVDPGPVFFQQERVGLGGRRFMCLKFRSMRQNAETRSHEGYLERLMKSDQPMTKLDAKGDARLIPFGRVLRATGLDELAQLFNVIRGEMSLVGPRPCTSKEFQHYEPHQRLRVNTLPGLTGYWQVNGKNKTTFSRMIELDVYYIKHQSLWLDFWIILKTFPTLMGQVFEVARRK
jgi:lipopolysaccharide/colanic/teichoic acid biosynthesis glycosyltransferase